MEKIPIIILAAGESKRLGFSKQLVQYQGNTLLNNSIYLAKSISENVTVVLGANYDNIFKSISNQTNINVLRNENWPSGMASSIKLAIEYHKIEAEVLIMLCDQFCLTTEILQQIVLLKNQTQKSIIACAYGERLGVPILFKRKIFKYLLELEGEKGANQILSKFLDDIAIVPFENGVYDIDTPDDLKLLL